MKNINLKAVYRTAGIIAVATIVIFSMATCDLDPPGGGGFGAPTGFTATATSSSTITLSWNAVSGATRYYVYQATSSGGSRTNLGYVTTASTNIDSLSSSTTYYFWVTAYNNNTDEESDYSSMASATTYSSSSSPAAPTGLTATATGTSTISLSWNAVSGATGYYVYYNTSSSTSGRTKFSNSSTTNSYSIIGCNPNTTYYFWVTAYNSYGESDYSSYNYATTLSSSGSGPQSNPISLSSNSWENGSITSSAPAQWYSFSVIAGNNYYVWWNDSDEGNSTKTVNVKVTLWFNDVQQSISGTSSWDHGWNSPSLSFNSNVTGTMKVKVEAYNSGNTGTFGICYSTNNYRPPTGSASGTQHDPIPLYDGYWENGSIPSGSSSEVWYSFMLPAGQAYRVYWNDYYDGNGTKTADIQVTGYINNNTSAWWTYDDSWSTSTILTNTGSNAFTVKLRVKNSSGSGGTFGIVYTSGTSRPAL